LNMADNAVKDSAKAKGEEAWKDSDFLTFDDDGDDGDDDDKKNIHITQKSKGTGDKDVGSATNKNTKKKNVVDENNKFGALANAADVCVTATASVDSSRKRPRYSYGNDYNNAPTPLRSLTSVTELPPWMDKPHSFKFHRNVPKLVLLHDEMVHFARMMAPQPDELKTREEVVARVTKLIHDTFDDTYGGAEKVDVQVFGSQATGLLLPTSDIDLVIQLPEYKKDGDDASKAKGDMTAEKKDKDGDGKKKSPKNKKKAKKKKKSKKKKKKTTSSDDDGVIDVDVDDTDSENEDDSKEKDQEAKRELTEKEREEQEMEEYNIHDSTMNLSPLAQLGAALRTQWKDDLSYLEVVENTRVPIVKFTHGPTNISVDICINQEHGRNAAELMKRFLDAMPPLKPLTFILKYFMASRGLNEPYSGGCGSFAVQMMIVSFLQHRERHSYNYRIPNTCNLGSLLIEFFELYGMDFNFLTTGISVRSDGFYFPKGAKGKKDIFYQPSRAFAMGMENPFDITADVGRPSFRMQLIQKSFEIALRVLLSHVAEPAVETESILAAILPPTEEMKERATFLKQSVIEDQLKKSGASSNRANKDDQDAHDMFCSDSSSDSDASS